MLTIEVKNLTKDFEKLRAVNQVSFGVEEGEIFGMLGPNGAGKTTIIKTLTTLLRPTSGEAKVWGFDIFKQKDEVRDSIGIVFQEPALDNRLTGRENLDFHARLYGLDAKTRQERIEEILNLVELKDKANVLVKNYSGGMQRRLEIGRGLMHFPRVLFLDEPTIGLDTQTRHHIWDYIIKCNKKEKITIILTTHYMEEADYLCKRVAIIDFGKIVALDTPYNLKNILGGDVISVRAIPSEKAYGIFRKLSWIKQVKQHGLFINLTVDKGEEKIPLLINIAQKEGINVESVNLRKPTLEDVFLHFTGKTIREAEASQLEKNIIAKRQM